MQASQEKAPHVQPLTLQCWSVERGSSGEGEGCEPVSDLACPHTLNVQLDTEILVGCTMV